MNDKHTINYTSIPKLAALLPYSNSTLNRLLANDEYKDFLTIDKDKRVITLNSSVIKGSNNNCFVRLTDKEISRLFGLWDLMSGNDPRNPKKP